MFYREERVPDRMYDRHHRRYHIKGEVRHSGHYRIFRRSSQVGIPADDL